MYFHLKHDDQCVPEVDIRSTSTLIPCEFLVLHCERMVAALSSQVDALFISELLCCDHQVRPWVKLEPGKGWNPDLWDRVGGSEMMDGYHTTQIMLDGAEISPLHALNLGVEGDRFVRKGFRPDALSTFPSAIVFY